MCLINLQINITKIAGHQFHERKKLLRNFYSHLCDLQKLLIFFYLKESKSLRIFLALHLTSSMFVIIRFINFSTVFKVSMLLASSTGFTVSKSSSHLTSSLQECLGVLLLTGSFKHGIEQHFLIFPCVFFGFNGVGKTSSSGSLMFTRSGSHFSFGLDRCSFITFSTASRKIKFSFSSLHWSSSNSASSIPQDLFCWISE